MDDYKSSESQASAPKRVFTPGDNPNKLNAQRRKNNRPKTQNSVPGAKVESRLTWADPLPIVDPSPLELEPQSVTIPAGEVTLNFDLPSVIAKPFSDAATSVLLRTNLDQAFITDVASKLESFSYYKACRQLYATLDDGKKSALQPLKTVYYDTNHIPTRMASALSMIGDFESKLGRVVVSHSVLLFKRWLLQGLSIDPDVPREEGVVWPENCATLVWKDKWSKFYIDERCREWLKNYHDTPFELEIDGMQPIRITPPLYDETSDPNQIDNRFPHRNTVVNMVTFLRGTVRQFASDPGIPNLDLRALLASLGLTLAEGVFSNPRDILEMFSDAQEGYITKFFCHIDAIFTTGESPAGSQGYAAQIVTSQKNEAKFAMPISDSDLALGYMFSPGSSFKIEPNFIAYGRSQCENVAARYSSRDLKKFAA